MAAQGAWIPLACLALSFAKLERKSPSRCADKGQFSDVSAGQARERFNCSTSDIGIA